MSLIYADSITTEAERQLIEALLNQGVDIHYKRKQIGRDTALYEGGMGLDLPAVFGAVLDFKDHNDIPEINTEGLKKLSTVGELADYLSQFL